MIFYLIKKSQAFWKTWKRKVCESEHKLPCVEGCYDEVIITEKFKTYFEKICTNNTSSHNVKMKSLFDAKLSSEMNRMNRFSCLVKDYLFNAETISIAISKLNSGKSPGFDELLTEHLTNAHPVLYVILSQLFCIIMRAGYVPNAFGNGILIPILKDTTKRGIQFIDNFRGITLSPIISKVFEHCIVLLYGDYFRTSHRQFGFKKETGCTQAIYCVRKVVDFYTENDSNVNICWMDISKAFDRLNKYQLFLKLMNRNVPYFLICVLLNWFNKSYSI